MSFIFWGIKLFYFKWKMCWDLGLQWCHLFSDQYVMCFVHCIFFHNLEIFCRKLQIWNLLFTIPNQVLIIYKNVLYKTLCFSFWWHIKTNILKCLPPFSCNPSVLIFTIFFLILLHCDVLTMNNRIVPLNTCVKFLSQFPWLMTWREKKSA